MDMLGYLVLRITFGMIFIMHGLQQLIPGFGGGKGLQGTQETITRIGFRPAWLWTPCLALGMLTGGLMLILGLFTVVGAAVVITIMVIAVTTTKLTRGFWNRNSGYEYNLALIGGTAAIGLLGPGPNSLDAVLAPFLLLSPAFFVVALIVCLGVTSLGFMTRQPAQREPS